MRVDGSWRVCDDGIIRPVFQTRIEAKDGSMHEVLFLADTAADRTVLSVEALALLKLDSTKTLPSLQGVGGTVNTVLVQTRIEFVCDDGNRFDVNGELAALTDVNALDMSVLGRDISYHFALIIDLQQDVVCLLGPGHRYTIHAN